MHRTVERAGYIAILLLMFAAIVGLFSYIRTTVQTSIYHSVQSAFQVNRVVNQFAERTLERRAAGLSID